MKDIFAKGIRTFFTTIIVCIICFFVVVSFNALKIGLFSQDIGYDVYGRTEENADPELLYTYYLNDVDEPKADKYKEQGYTLTEKPITAEVTNDDKTESAEIGFEVYGKKGDAQEELLYKYYTEKGNTVLSEQYKENNVELFSYSIRSEVEKSADIACSVISQIFCLVILVSFVYSELWKAGNKDFETARLYSTPVNKLKGLYIGLVAVIPSVAFLVFSLATQNTIMSKLPVAIFTFSNCYAYEIIFAVTNGVMYWADVQWWQALVYFAILLIVPITALVSYIIGVNDISISEKLVYKNSKKIRRG